MAEPKAELTADGGRGVPREEPPPGLLAAQPVLRRVPSHHIRLVEVPHALIRAGAEGRPRSGRAHTGPLSVVPPQRNADTGGGQDGRRWAVEVDHARVDAAFGDTKNRVALMRLLAAQLKDVRRDESSSEQLS